MIAIAPAPARITSWDRAAIVALGGAGCALSYDALQQMAVAIHIRGILTFVFPLVIDGFIAYGVRALLVLRAAPLASRCYVWILFGTATAASIWANALHAVRLNQHQPEERGLRLGDLTVGILSTLAPLALAGAVHLYILIARRGTEDRPSTQRLQEGHEDVQVTTGPERELAEPEPEHNGRDSDLLGDAAPRHRSVTRLHLAKHQVTTPDTAPAKRLDTGDRKANSVTDEQLLAIARQAVTEAGDLTRKVVADGIRGRGHGLGNDRLTRLMEHLREEAKESSDTRTS